MAKTENRIVTTFDANKIFDDKVRKLDPENRVVKKRSTDLNFDCEIKCKGEEEEKQRAAGKLAVRRRRRPGSTARNRHTTSRGRNLSEAGRVALMGPA